MLDGDQRCRHAVRPLARASQPPGPRAERSVDNPGLTLSPTKAASAIFIQATIVDLVHESILSWSKLQVLARSRIENQTNAAEPELQVVATVHDKPSSKKKSLSS